MMSVAAIGAVTGDIAPSKANSTTQASGADFANLIGDQLQRADQSLKTADSQLTQLAAGDAIPVHDVMISMEKARLDLMLVVEVRNRVIEGYQELMRMQL
jgi:flagellar hook-basal body complex protein FliE